MHTNPPSTVEEAARRRVNLYHAILELERASARPAVEREREWVEGVIQALERLDAEIDEHIDITERDGGLYDEIAETAPRLRHKVTRLRDEHPQLRDTTRQLLGQFRSTPPDSPEGVTSARDQVQRLLGQLVKHRQHGADLVWEAYNPDIGGIG